MVLRTQLEVPTEDLPFLRMVLAVLDIMMQIYPFHVMKFCFKRV